MTGIGLVGVAGMLMARENGLPSVERARVALLILVAGLAGYIAYASGWLGMVIREKGSPLLAAGVALACAALPLAWVVVRNRKR